jgi:hypothetical protein
MISTDNGGNWIPIRPSNESVVTGERIFPNQATATAYTRFPFVLDSLSVYRNGRKLNQSSDQFVTYGKDENGFGTSVGLKAIVYGAEHQYTVDYTPATSAAVSLGHILGWPSSGSEGKGSVRVAIVLRNNGTYPSSPQVFSVQIKGKVGEDSG